MSSSPALIAMVDDDSAVVRLVTAFLEAYDYRTVSCGSSAEAMPLIQSTHPDLVLLDIQMESWDAGLQVLAALRQHAATQDVPVIICSANVPLLRQQAGAIRALGAQVLPKPYTLDTLLATVDQVLRRPPRSAPAA